MGIHRNLKLKELADQIFAEIVQLSSRSRKLIVKQQLLDAAEAASANIGEAFGRGTKADRNRVLFIVRGEVEESIQHLRANHVAKRIADRPYWRLIIAASPWSR